MKNYPCTLLSVTMVCHNKLASYVMRLYIALGRELIIPRSFAVCVENLQFLCLN